MFLMLFIFFLVLVFTVLYTFVKEITNFVGRHLFSATDEELDLRAKVRDMKDEQSRISMIDEFARYMKLQRQIDKLIAKVKESGSSRQKKMTMLGLGVNTAVHILHVLVMMTLVVSHRAEPLMSLPEGWFFPVQKLVALPSGVTGGVGIVCWILVCNSVIHRAKRLLV
ncbi:guided entry of tail-anchored proteins factor 1-like [Babylonia areolata]|uniref:guided entry of tail-anchored proteins factor 1-like n=1 Tax=Babylonia areolata TaxID=304850 RepID=UPI003FD36F6B